MKWYADYVERHAADGAEGRLVSMHRFRASWDMWEMHPSGSEVVLCTSGRLTVHQEKADGARASTTLDPGQYVVNEPGTLATPPTSMARRPRCSSPQASAPSIGRVRSAGDQSRSRFGLAVIAGCSAMEVVGVSGRSGERRSKRDRQSAR